MIDVALIYPPWAVLDDRSILQNSLPPLGILSMASYLESKNYSMLPQARLMENLINFP